MSKEILKQLGRLDLIERQEAKARELMSKLGRFGFFAKTLNPGDSIIRARPNYNDERFFLKSDYAYKPQHLNLDYARASTPNQTMFYGCLQKSISKKERKKGLTGRHIAALETFEWLRSRTTSCFQIVSFVNWVVSQPMKVGVIVKKKYYFKRTEFTSEIVSLFEESLKNSPELKDYTIAVLDFFAKQFKRYDANSKHSYRYILSALFSELVARTELDGIMYPSVRVGGKGFNLAIKPDAVNNKMELKGAGECHIYKKKLKTFVNNVTVFKLKNNQTSFPLIPITNANYTVSEETCLKMIKAKSKSELNNCKEWDAEANKLYSIFDRFLQWVYRY